MTLLSNHVCLNFRIFWNCLLVTKPAELAIGRSSVKDHKQFRQKWFFFFFSFYSDFSLDCVLVAYSVYSYCVYIWLHAVLFNNLWLPTSTNFSSITFSRIKWQMRTLSQVFHPVSGSEYEQFFFVSIKCPTESMIRPKIYPVKDSILTEIQTTTPYVVWLLLQSPVSPSEFIFI